MDATAIDFTSAAVSRAVPTEACIEHAAASLITSLPEDGLGFEHIKKHILNDVAPAFTGLVRAGTLHKY
jgi:hypothetical protein